MPNVQKAIFPAILVGIAFVFLVTRLIANPHVVLAANDGVQSDTAARLAAPLTQEKAHPTPAMPQAANQASEPNAASQPNSAGQATPVPVVEPIFVTVTVEPQQRQALLGASGSGSGDGTCSLSPLFAGSVRQWCDLIEKYARQNGLEPGLVAALITQESGGDPNAYSSSGAVGLMQVMPSDGIASGFMCATGPCFSNRPSSQELRDPEYNIAYGTKMLAELTQKNGSVREALKNYGPINVGYYYADLVLGIFSSHP